MRPNSPRIASSPGIIIYDGTCGMCSAATRKFHRLFANRRFEVLPSQDEKVKTFLPADFVGAPSEILVLIPDSSVEASSKVYRLTGGIDATLYIAGQFPLIIPLVWILKLPGFHWLADRFYKAIAKRRYQISRVCRLEPNIKRHTI